ncbi:hypothetical protein F5141DRAFT_1068394 [Pisolithus sp. B1]|nr:hypothetical protein F5141DRAFT_1068394 [Pisolithus sp. B1]
MLYYRDYESYESQPRHESSVRRSSSSVEGQLVVEWLQSTPRPLDGMPRGKVDDVPRCPAVWYSKHDLYDLIDEQKKVKIDLYKALLDYQLHFTKVAAHLQVMSQLSSIEKDDLFLKGFDQEFQNDPWPTCQVTQEAERLLKKGYRLELREVHITGDQQRAREAWYEARVQELKAMEAEEQCQGMEKSVRLGSKASQSRSSTALKIQLLTHSLQESSKLSKVPGESSRSQALEVDGIEVAMAEPSSSPLVEG